MGRQSPSNTLEEAESEHTEAMVGEQVKKQQ